MGSGEAGFTASHSDRQLYSIKRSVRSSTPAGDGQQGAGARIGVGTNEPVPQRPDLGYDIRCAG